jgi:phosphinothricin acetyltransferase
MRSSNSHIRVRLAQLDDLPALTEIINHYVVHTHATFDVAPSTPEQRLPWFKDHSSGQRYQMLVAEDPAKGVVGFACSGRHRPKAAYDTTVETSVYCKHDFVGRGLGTLLYTSLFEALSRQDIHRFVAGIAQPNDPSNTLHRRLGFKEIGTYSQVGRKFGKYWDVLWMERPAKLP